MASSKKMPTKKLPTVKWPIDKLKPHPKQSACFPDPPESEIKELAEQIRNGLDHPIEILPDGTIICGHRRTLAARLLGWEEIDVLVRHDLEEAGDAAIEARLIEDNLFRRQLDELQIARCCLRLKELAAKADGHELFAFEKGDLRDAIGKKLGMSGRNLSRLLRIVEHTPQAVQDAVSAKKLAMTKAEQVAGLPLDVRDQIAEEISNGAEPEEVVSNFLTNTAVKSKSPHDAIRKLLRSVRQGLDNLEGCELSAHWFGNGYDAVFQRGEKLLKRLSKAAKAAAKSIDENRIRMTAEEELALLKELTGHGADSNEP